MERPDFVNEGATLGPCHEMVRIAYWRRKDAIQIGWQERLLGRPANDPWGLRRGAWIAHQHLYPIKHKRLRPEKECARRIKNIRGHVIAIRPDAQLRIIEKVSTKVKGIAVPSAGGIAGLRNGDTLDLRDAGSSYRELTDNPPVSQRIIDHHRIATASLTVAAKARPNRADGDGAKHRCACNLVKNLEANVHQLEVLSFAHIPICIGRRAVAAHTRERNAGPIQKGAGNGRRVHHPLPKTVLNDRVRAILVLIRYFRVEIRFALGTHFARRPHNWLLAQQQRHIAVQRGNYSHLACSLCLGRAVCICLGRCFRERAKAKQRQKDAGQDYKQTD